MQPKQKTKKIIAFRFRCRRPGAGLSHYIMLTTQAKKEIVK